MKIYQSWKRNIPSTVSGESITITIVCSSFAKDEIDQLEEKLNKGVIVTETKPKPAEELTAMEIDGLWCDDISFCQEECDWMGCPRNKKNIRDRTVAHSYFVDTPPDCPKTKGEN